MSGRMAGRIVLFGATGYTGRLVSEALAGRGARPLLAGRNQESLEQLSQDLGGGFETAVADVQRPETIRALVEPGDVLVSTVGPFNKWGDAAVQAAIDAGADLHRLDRRVALHPQGVRALRVRGRARRLRAGHRVRLRLRAGEPRRRPRAGGGRRRRGGLKIGYFLSGGGSKRDAMSGGTAASAAGVAVDKAYGYRDGRLVEERPAKRVRSFPWGEKSLTGISIGCSEHFALPRLQPGLREVDVYLGWLGPASRAAQVFSAMTELPGARTGIRALLGRFGAKGSSGGPDAEARSKSGSRIVAEASDAAGNLLARVQLEGPNGYTFTGEVMGWGAERAAQHGVEGSGALGPGRRLRPAHPRGGVRRGRPQAHRALTPSFARPPKRVRSAPRSPTGGV